MAAVIGCAALCLFGARIGSTPFVDEYAYITQSFYADLFFAGHANDKLWLESFACDLQPLPKYLIGLMLRLANLPIPTPADAAAWYHDGYREFGTHATLVAARVPTIFLGALGCVSLFACGVLVKDYRAGAAAAVLLMLNAVYSLHAHRAMSDVPCESFMVSGLAAGLWAWKRTWSRGWGASVFAASWLAGLLAGLSLLCKFNGFLGLAIAAGWLGLALIAPYLAVIRKVALAAMTIVTMSTAATVLVAMNPYMTAHPRLSRYDDRLLTAEARAYLAENPLQRFQSQLKLRREISSHQRVNFPNDALHRVPERVEVLLVQGLGRFGPLGPAESDSTVRFEFRQDWGLVLWAPFVAFGIVQALRLGREQWRSRQPPTGVALLIWVAVAWIVLAMYLPMAWDRYLLPIQSGNALLGGLAAAAIWDRVAPRRPESASEG